MCLRECDRDILEEESCSVSCISGYLKMHTSIYIPVTVTEMVTQLNWSGHTVKLLIHFIFPTFSKQPNRPFLNVLLVSLAGSYAIDRLV